MVRFAEFDFGLADGKTELLQRPQLVRTGHFDPDNIEEKLLQPQHYLVLGYKGSGKTTVAARLQIMAKDEPHRYRVPEPLTINKALLEDLHGIMPASRIPGAAALRAWQLLLLLRIIEQIAKDDRATKESQQRTRLVARRLKKHRIISRTPRTIDSFRLTELSGSFSLREFFRLEARVVREEDARRQQAWIDHLTHVCVTFRSPRTHIVLVDGLDEAGVVHGETASLLGGLVQAADDLNNRLLAGSAPIKTVVCCLTDLYERLDVPNRARLRRDRALELNWFDPHPNKLSKLARLADTRARLTEPGLTSLFDEYFPEIVEGSKIVAHLAAHTRHTPRDFLTLLSEIRDCWPEDGKVTPAAINAGLTRYSEAYFRGELESALDSYFELPHKQAIVTALGLLKGNRAFKRDVFKEALSRMPDGQQVDVDLALEALFECSFIGGETRNPDERYYYRFRHSNPAMSAMAISTFEFHPGLRRAFGVG